MRSNFTPCGLVQYLCVGQGRRKDADGAGDEQMGLQLTDNKNDCVYIEFTSHPLRSQDRSVNDTERLFDEGNVGVHGL